MTVDDYFSIYTIPAVLSWMSAAHVIYKLKQILARCEIPKLFIEGRGPYINTSDAYLVLLKIQILFLAGISEVMLPPQQRGGRVTQT